MATDISDHLQSSDIAKAYYDVARRIPNKSWKEFVRVALKLPEHCIDDIENDYKRDVLEQKFQMLKQWGRSQRDMPDKNVLLQIVEQFLRPSCRPTEQVPQSDERSIALVFDEKVSPQVDIAKNLFDNYSVHCFDCKSNAVRSEDYVPEVEKHTYRVFILTGRFQTSNLPTFMPLLQKSSVENTLLIARKPNIPDEISHLPLRTTDRMAGDEFFALINGFIADSDYKASSREQCVYATETMTEDQLDEGESSEEDIDPEIYKQYAALLNDKGFPDCHYDRKHAYILILGPVRERMPQLRSLVLIPWLRVFDFDPKTRVLGCLSNVETTLKSLRHFTTTDSKDKIEHPEERETNWVFINGYCDSNFAAFKDAPEIPDKAVFDHCDSLVSYCAARKVPKIVVLWYASQTNYDDRLCSFMNSLKYHLKSQLNSFKCVVCFPSKPHKLSARAQMVKQLKLEDSLVIIPLDVLCMWIKKTSAGNSTSSESKTLPQFSEKRGEKGIFHLSDKDSKWLDICFDVLASNDCQTEGNLDGEDFLKGGKLGWEIIATGKYDADRDILQEKVRFVTKKYIETGKSGIITIFHPPGGGGTTFTRRLLWELRKEAPCLELLSMEVSIEEVKKRLSFIRNETHLPAVLLIDGNSHLDVKTLLENCRYEKVVILHVQRFYSSFNVLNRKKKKTDLIWVPESVSQTEAKRLLEIFSSARPDRKSSLVKLTEDAESKKDICMFEYGLTTYDADYRGVKSYVHGNLQISRETELENWHKVLAYLSLAHYFGPCLLPSKLFSSLLQKNDEDIVALDDLPHQARKFVIEDENGDWKITYYIVAKEILEQVLVKRKCPEYSYKKKTLSNEARQNLWKIAIDFIKFVKENMDHIRVKEIPSHVQNILTSILIKRNYKDAGENDEFGSKSKYSRLIEDTTTDEQKKAILVTLVQSFPSNAEFHAHLGRFYGKTRQFVEAEQNFSKAFEVRKNEKKMHLERISGDPVLHRIHSMYGFYLNEQVKNEISEARTLTSNKQTVKRILDKAKKAVLNFQSSKKHYQEGCNPTYVYIGEIKVRLMLAEFANKLSGGNIAKLRNDQDPFSSLSEFVFDSFSHCDQLLVQCMYYAEEHNIPQDELDYCINNFNSFFKDTEMALRNWVGQDKTVRSKKGHVAILKIEMMKGNEKGHSHKFQVYEDICGVRYLQDLIKLYEGIFNDTQKRELEHHPISNYMIEWLQAIGHPLLKNQDYPLTQVNSRVECWDLKNERGSLATFYHYVLTTLLAIQGPRGEVTNTYSEQSCVLKERIKDCMIPRPLIERTAEWLAENNNSQSFRNLIHRSLLGEWDGKFWKKDKASLLKVCKGRISTCKIWYGHIVLDGGQQPEITLFFNPQRYGFSGSDSRKKLRVEFYMGFNPNHGAEAYQVVVLEKHDCHACQTPTEISKLGREQSLWSGQCPKCEDEVILKTKS